MNGLYPHYLLASFAFALLLAGFGLRKRSRYGHAGLMAAGMAIDLALVLVLQLTKDAVGTVAGESLSVWQYAHVSASTTAVILYVPVFSLGWIRLRQPSAPAKLRTLHRRLGYIALTFRALGFLFMFSMLSRH